MRTCKIMLHTVSDVRELVTLVSDCTYDVELVSGRYAIDAKSIMGIFSIDLSKELVLKAHTDNADAVKADLSEYIVG